MSETNHGRNGNKHDARGFFAGPLLQKICILWHFCLLCSAGAEGRERIYADAACEEEKSDSEAQKTMVTG